MPCGKTSLLSVCLGLVLLAALPLKAEETPAPLTMEKAVEEGLRANQGIQAAQSAMARAEAALKAAWGALLPRVDASYSRNRIHNDSEASERDADYLNQHTTTWTINLRQPLFYGGALVNQVAKARLERTRQKLLLRQTQVDLASDIRQTFVNILWHRAAARAYATSVERLRGHLQAAQAFFQVGEKPWLAVLEAQVDLAEAEQNLAKARNQERVFTVKLQSLLGRSTEEDAHFAGELADFVGEFPYSREECITRANALRPDIRALETMAEMADKDMRIAASDALPRVSLNLGYTDQNIDYDNYPQAEVDRQYVSGGVQLQWNLFAGGQTYQEVQQARHDKDRLMAKRDEARTQARSEITQFFLEMQDARSRMDVAKASMASAQEAFEMAEVRFKTGEGTATDVLDAQTRVVNAELSLARARAEYLQAQFALLRSVGVLNVNEIYSFPVAED
ncbi:MAG: TolC family protein [Desulfomicrobiaceae bacterium]|nr:TolC family protein [Desulfomicrobiaceae bacterium]